MKCSVAYPGDLDKHTTGMLRAPSARDLEAALARCLANPTAVSLFEFEKEKVWLK